MGRLAKYEFADFDTEVQDLQAPYLRSIVDVHGEGLECQYSAFARVASSRFTVCRHFWTALNGIGLCFQALRIVFAVLSWLAFSAYVLLLPWIANWANDALFDYKPQYSYGSNGLCTRPASDFECSNGQNFTELALQHRGVAIGCGCGEGVFGEALCPFAPWGYTLSDIITTSVAAGILGGLSIVPLAMSWQYVDVVNVRFRPMPFMAAANWWSMAVFQVSYIVFLGASNCIFPRTHGAAVYAWPISYFIHAMTLTSICSIFDRTGQIIISMAVVSSLIMLLGMIPEFVQQLNTGLGSWIFMTAEGISMSGAFGITPMVMLFGKCQCHSASGRSVSDSCSYARAQPTGCRETIAGFE
mmetsp:Transcript_52416/g.125221  ORF Transcript_52416/g.125221 Transcript_52416/m.125221 type:complete len:357 (-) Transcript_52416:147-1217(-)